MSYIFIQDISLGQSLDSPFKNSNLVDILKANDSTIATTTYVQESYSIKNTITYNDGTDPLVFYSNSTGSNFAANYNLFYWKEKRIFIIAVDIRYVTSGNYKPSTCFLTGALKGMCIDTVDVIGYYMPCQETLSSNQISVLTNYPYIYLENAPNLDQNILKQIIPSDGTKVDIMPFKQYRYLTSEGYSEREIPNIYLPKDNRGFAVGATYYDGEYWYFAFNPWLAFRYK